MVSNPNADRPTKFDADDFDMPPSTSQKIWSSPDADEGARNLSKLAMSPSFFRTPSNWGTPDVSQCSRLEKPADIFAEDPGQLMQSMWAPFPLNFSAPPPPDPRLRSDVVQPTDAQAGPPMVRLRGLPFDTTKQEVCSLFSHKGLSDRIADESNSIQILTKSNGKPSGNALVQLRKVEDIGVVQTMLHLTTFGTRYVEVLPHPPVGSQAPNPQLPYPQLRQDSIDQVQLNAMQSAQPPMQPGSTLYSDAWLLTQLAASVAQCAPEHNSYNAGFNFMPVEVCSQGHHGLRV